MKLTLAMSAAAMPEPEEGKPSHYPLEIEVGEDAVYLRANNGRQAWIEIDAEGNLIVHAYNADIDEPVNVRILSNRIDIDTDRENGTFRKVWCRSYGTGLERIKLTSGEAPDSCPDCNGFNISLSKL